MSQAYKIFGKRFLLIALLAFFTAIGHMLWSYVTDRTQGDEDFEFAINMFLITSFFLPSLLLGFSYIRLSDLADISDLADEKVISLPKLGMAAFWLLCIGLALLVLAIFMFSPTTNNHSSSWAIDLSMSGVHLAGLAFFLGSISVIHTLYKLRKDEKAARKIPWLFWSLIIIFCIVFVIALPIFAGAITMLLTDRNFNTTFFSPAGGGDPVIFSASALVSFPF